MYSDKFGNFFGRTIEDGNIAVLHIENGSAATRLDQSTVYPVDSQFSCLYEHPEGIILTKKQAEALNIEID